MSSRKSSDFFFYLTLKVWIDTIEESLVTFFFLTLKASIEAIEEQAKTVKNKEINTNMKDKERKESVTISKYCQ